MRVYNNSTRAKLSALTRERQRICTVRIIDGRTFTAKQPACQVCYPEQTSDAWNRTGPIETQAAAGH